MKKDVFLVKYSPKNIPRRWQNSKAIDSSSQEQPLSASNRCSNGPQSPDLPEIHRDCSDANKTELPSTYADRHSEAEWRASILAQSSPESAQAAGNRPEHNQLNADQVVARSAEIQSQLEIMTGNFTDLTGQNIAHYLLERRLGGGAMASVYQATDQILDRTIALKVLMPGADSLTRERFRQEARTVSILDHPHIVRTLQVGQTSANGIAYIAMELIDGQSLSGLLERYGTLSVEDTANLLEPIAQALSYAHSLGVVHRDVKPSNILLRNAQPGDPGGVQLSILEQPVKAFLSDFGIARALDSPELTSAGRTIGTPSYMAPEQCAGSREIDGRADIYSLGAVLYRCLVGRPPFVGTTTQILHAHVYEPLTIPDEVVNKLPKQVVETLQHSLMKDVEVRYRDAALMADSLAVAAGRQPARVATIARAGATQTMNSIPATVVEETGSTSQILVPGPGASALPAASAATSSGWSPHSTPSSVRRVGSTTHSKITRPLPSSPSVVGKRRELNWVSLTLGAALLLLLVLVGLAVVNAFLPNSIDGATEVPAISTPAASEGIASVDATAENQAGQVPTEEAAVGKPTSAPEAATAAPDSAETESSSNGDDDGAGVESGVNGNASIDATENLTDTEAISTTQELTDVLAAEGIDITSLAPAVSAESTWDDAQYFYKVRDWQQALVYLTLLQRRDPDFEAESVAAMEVPIYLGLAGEAAAAAVAEGGDAQAKMNNAVSLLNRAADLRPEDSAIRELLNATRRFVDAPEDQLRSARVALSETYAEYATTLAEAEDFCGAAEQLLVAVKVSYNAEWADQQVAYLEQCPQEEQGNIQPAAIANELAGIILYSAQQSGQNAIWQMPAAKEAESSLLVSDGRLPSLNPAGTRLAFRSDTAPQEGIRGADIGRDPENGLFYVNNLFRFTYHIEDSTESAPQWSPSGGQIIYASTVAGDRVSRIYYANNNPSGNFLLSADGREPDWHPSQDLLVFKGADLSGNSPGLWLMAHTGGDRQQLTNNQSDTRPVWSPDGNTVVFMSNERDGNWDIYKVDISTKQVVRLTDDAANDGLPAVSPDGDYVAFVSDRLNGWQIWVVPLEGGPATPLAKIAGNLPNWWEHSIQWAP